MNKDYHFVYLRDTEEHLSINDQELEHLLQAGLIEQSNEKKAQYRTTSASDSESVAESLIAFNQEPPKPLKKGV